MLLGQFAVAAQRFGGDAFGGEDIEQVLLAEVCASIKWRMIEAGSACGTGSCFGSYSSINTVSKPTSFFSAGVTDFFAILACKRKHRLFQEPACIRSLERDVSWTNTSKCLRR